MEPRVLRLRDAAHMNEGARELAMREALGGLGPFMAAAVGATAAVAAEGSAELAGLLDGLASIAHEASPPNPLPVPRELVAAARHALSCLEVAVQVCGGDPLEHYACRELREALARLEKGGAA